MEFKYITDPLAKAYVDRFSLYDHNQITSAESLEEYSIDENQNGGTDYRSVNPDFNFIQFRCKMVFRWEYKPGSELFLVWSKNNSISGDPSESGFTTLQEVLFSSDMTNTRLPKLTYRFY